MRNINKEVKEVKEEVVNKYEKKYILKIEYLDFIESLIKDKVVVSKENKEEVESRYNSIYGRKFSNIKRVISRSNREKVKVVKFSELEKRKIVKKEVIKVEKELLLLSSRSNSNIIVI